MHTLLAGQYVDNGVPRLLSLAFILWSWIPQVNLEHFIEMSLILLSSLLNDRLFLLFRHSGGFLDQIGLIHYFIWLQQLHRKLPQKDVALNALLHLSPDEFGLDLLWLWRIQFQHLIVWSFHLFVNHLVDLVRQLFVFQSHGVKFFFEMIHLQ